MSSNIQQVHRPPAPDWSTIRMLWMAETNNHISKINRALNKVGLKLKNYEELHRKFRHHGFDHTRPIKPYSTDPEELEVLYWGKFKSVLSRIKKKYEIVPIEGCQHCLHCQDLLRTDDDDDSANISFYDDQKAPDWETIHQLAKEATNRNILGMNLTLNSVGLKLKNFEKLHKKYPSFCLMYIIMEKPETSDPQEQEALHWKEFNSVLKDIKNKYGDVVPVTCQHCPHCKATESSDRNVTNGSYGRKVTNVLNKVFLWHKDFVEIIIHACVIN